MDAEQLQTTVWNYLSCTSNPKAAGSNPAGGALFVVLRNIKFFIQLDSIEINVK